MRRWAFVGIIILGFILRFWQLNKYPVGFTPDEASFGYDAYSIIKTGKDQWGNVLPIVLKSFGDYKAPVLTYLMIPSIIAGGLEKISVRIPNALLGSLAVLIVYFFVKKLLESFKNELDSDKIALLTSLLLAISSWHIMMSRGAFEANLTTFFLPLGLLFLILGLKKPAFLYLGTLILGINMFTYHAAKIVTPAVLAFFIILFGKKYLIVKKKHILGAFGIFAVFLGITAYTFSIGAGARVADVSIAKGIVDASAEYKMNAYSMGVNPILTRILYSKFSILFSRFLENYASYFSPQYLFTKGPSEATYGMIPGRGVLYLFELPFIFGFLASLFKAKNKKVYLFILLWLAAAPVPASLTSGAGYAGNRAETMIPALQIILAIGAIETFIWLKRILSHTLFKAAVILYSLFAGVLFVGFLADYFLISPARNASAMLSGNLEVANYLKDNFDSDTKIVVSRSLSEPQIYIAFAGNWNPESYQKAAKEWNYKELYVNWVDQIPSYNLGNYTFKGINMDDYKNGSDMDIVVGKPGEFPSGVKTQKIIYQPDGTAACFVVKASDLVINQK